MILLVTGSRKWTDFYLLNAELNAIHEATPIELLIHGDADGADAHAKAWAKANEIPYLSIPAKWKKNFKAAGPIRNSVMLDFMGIVPTHYIAFSITASLEESRGTADMVKKADKAGIKQIKVVTNYQPLE
jgi:hypothetical protein